MSLLHYFGNNPDKRAQFIFNFIAPIYGYVDAGLQKSFAISADLLNKEIEIKGKRILDVGCGTGAWLTSLSKHNPAVCVGADFSDKMLNEAKSKHSDFRFEKARAEDLSIFQDNEFDIVTASYVLHGVTKAPRSEMLKEMQRVAKEYVIIHDFYGKTAPFVQFLEFMERSDYKNFKKHFAEEMNSQFEEAKMIDTETGTGLYIGAVLTK